MKRNISTAIFSGAGMLALILDSKTALFGAAMGLDICIRTVIPSLLPFFFLSILLNSSLMGKKIPLLSAVGRLCGLPKGAENLLFTGFMGGYPVGAQGVNSAYSQKIISKTDRDRLLGFCSNAGPAFIFGMGSGLFPQKWIPWVIWLIHMTSAIMVGILLPNKSASVASFQRAHPIAPAQALKQALSALTNICGWVICFRVFMAFFTRWFLWILPEPLEIALLGLLELSNGTILLNELENLGLRFILFSVFLGFGGICVWMQTVSVTGQEGLGMYLTGKLLQSSISLILSYFAQLVFFSPSHRASMHPLIAFGAASLCFLSLFLQKQKIKSSNPIPFGV